LLLEQAEKQRQIFAETYKKPLSKEFLDQAGAPKYQYVFNRKAEDIANRANLYAIQLIQSGLLLDAAHWLRRFIDLYDRSPTLFYNLGQVYNTQKIWYQAAQNAWQATELKKDYRDTYDLLGSALFKIGDFESYVRLYEEAVAIDANDAMGYYNLGCSYNAMSVLDKAEKNWMLAVKHDKVERAAFSAVARSDDIKVALSVRAEPVSYLALFSLGSLYLYQDKRDAALSAFQTASGLSSNKPAAYLEIGKIFLSLNKIDQAKKSFDKYLALGGDSLKVKTFLKK
jgi:tetratricopeptide (TPR) repeat protein